MAVLILGGNPVSKVALQLIKLLSITELNQISVDISLFSIVTEESGKTGVRIVCSRDTSITYQLWMINTDKAFHAVHFSWNGISYEFRPWPTYSIY